MTLIYEDYIKYHDEYTKKYGPKTIVFLEVGSFFELYAIPKGKKEKDGNDDDDDNDDNDDNDEKNSFIGCDMNAISSILDIQITRKNKKIKEATIHNPLMAGFPSHSVGKFRDKLLNEGYSIILIEQVTKPPNPERQVTEILSPGTVVDAFNPNDTNYLVSVFIDSYKVKENDNKLIYSVGLAAINLSTGKNYVHSFVTLKQDPGMWRDETYRLMQYYNPSECIVHYGDDLKFTLSELSQMWDIDEHIIHNNTNSFPEIAKNSYQNEFLGKVFKETEMLSPVEFLDMEREKELLMSYILMIQFVYEHKINNIMNIFYPERINDTNYLVLTNNSIRQLNISDNYSYYKGQNDSLLSIVNKCLTAPGRRLCKERILSPSIDVQEIEQRYHYLDLYQTKHDEVFLYSIVREHISSILDIERLQRKISLSLINPSEFYALHQSYNTLQKLNGILKEIEYMNPFVKEHEHSIEKLTELQRTYEKIFMTDELERYISFNQIDQSVFQKDIYPEIDELDIMIKKNKNYIFSIAKELSKYVDKKAEMPIKVEYNEINDWHLVLTRNRGKTLKSRLQNLSNRIISFKDNEGTEFLRKDISDILIKDCKNASCIIFTGENDRDEINVFSNRIVSASRKLIAHNKEKYLLTIHHLYSEFKDHFDTFVKYLSQIDLYSTFAKVSLENNYSKPIIVKSEKSSFVAKDLRHPIVERINNETEYVPNDISLDEDGILLFGTNACGKSTLMKAVGLAIVMAQAGLYVPCSEYTFSPYTQLFTRILGNDNIFRGQSSFVVEMTELRSILKRSNKNSMVLGDELCSGTENISAMSIIGSGLKHLSDMKCSFIFTSHLHGLTNMPIIQNLVNLRIHHLKINYDEERDLLIYDRKLEEGSGPAIYGLEVCKAMDMGNDFISTAREIQMNLTDTSPKLINPKRSRYNSDVYMDLCAVCKKNAEHTHHIKEQNTADENGMIEHFHKNKKHNLIPLCEECHIKVHHGDLDIKGFIQTNKGILLDKNE